MVAFQVNAQEGPKTLFAVWEVDSGFNQVTYNSNLPTAQDCTLAQTTSKLVPAGFLAVSPSDVELCIPATEPSRFYGWNTQSDGSGTSYYPGDLAEESGLRLSTLDFDQRTVSLYALWAPKSDACPILTALKPENVVEQQGIGKSEAKRLGVADFSGGITNNLFFVDGVINNIKFIGGQQAANAQPSGKPPVNWMGCNLKNAFLLGANLKGAYLVDAMLNLPNGTPAILDDANLTRADLTDADLTDADLIRVKLTDATLSGVTLTGATLIEAVLIGATLSDTYFGYCKILTGCLGFRTDLSGATMSGATLTGADLTGAGLTGVTLIGADLTKAKLFEAVLTGADQTGADQTGVRWSNTTCPNGTVTPIGTDVSCASL